MMQAILEYNRGKQKPCWRPSR